MAGWAKNSPVVNMAAAPSNRRRACRPNVRPPDGDRCTDERTPASDFSICDIIIPSRRK